MRILYFTRDYTPHDHRFLSALARTGHEVFSLRLERRSLQLEDRPLPVEIRQVAWRGGRGPAGWRDFPTLWLDLKRVLREIKPDLVHAGPVPTVAFLAALSGFRPLLSMSWGSDLLRDVDRDANLRRAAQFALRRSSVLVGDCQAVRQKAVRMGFPAERVVLFPWGVDLERFQPGPQEAEFRRAGAEWEPPFVAPRALERVGGWKPPFLGWQDAFVLLSLRTWEPVYGVDVIAHGFVRAAQQIANLRLILLGSGSQAALIREILRKGGVEDRVYLGGQVTNEQLPHFYRAADLYLSASHSDGSSVSLMEALATGLPALVSDIPGNREWLDNSAAGWLFGDGDEVGLADGIIRAYNQRQELALAGQAARRLAEERADWSKNFQCLLAAYQMALDGAEATFLRVVK